MEISKFIDKLNRVDGNIYVIEEAVQLIDGMYESELQHDNINDATFAVYTGSKLTGERLDTYVLSTPSLAPWKRIVRVYADVDTVYLSYETSGDTVEAEDINGVQGAVVDTQQSLNAEVVRAGSAEQELTENLQSEIDRATTAETILSDKIAAETQRAADAEYQLSDDLKAETDRAKRREDNIETNLIEEAARAKAAEKTNADSITAEQTRATAKEGVLTADLSAEIERAKAAESSIRDTVSTNKPNWDDKYTRNEVDNKFATLESNIDWKESVGTYDDILTAYPEPEDGWTVNVRDTDYTYRWNGTAWVAISANAIPKATQGVDGLLSKEDKADYDDAYSKRHAHGNKSVIDKITQTLLDNWSAAYTHISDAVRHVTSAERTKWDAVTNKVDKVSGKGLSANDYTAAEKSKLSGIAASAEVNVQPDWNVADAASDAFIKNKPEAFPPSSHSHAYSAITGKPSTFPPAAHTHDDRYYTETEMNAKLNGKANTTHTQAADTITEGSAKRFVSDAEKNKWNSLNNTAIVTIPASSWSTVAPYTAKILVAGLKATDKVKIYAYTPKDIGAAQTKLRRKLTALITDGESQNGSMAFYCIDKKPTSDFVVLLEGVSING